MRLGTQDLSTKASSFIQIKKTTFSLPELPLLSAILLILTISSS